ncbi:hypothetical protein ACIOC2_11895 [Streptomyces sp. NPDC088337]|uniref:hypothetical protein n=1 Tax=unclassified Streptomyces TaxID=2593676 RepID=UPI002DD9CA89|nr:hypothetical protein [Streptomyces sp. NBC_01788]WSB27979.1 hypothetical protein OIE49_20025 [Streptomyces sp. NBC_01788]
MPTPYGTRGGMAFGAEELLVLRRALALALQPRPASAEDVRDCRRLAESLDEALHEGARLRAFLVADLARYRAALPGTVTGYLALLAECLGAGHRPTADDLSALAALSGNPTAAALLRHCGTLAPPVTSPRTVHPVPAARPAPAEAPAPAGPFRPGGVSAVVPACRGAFRAVAGGQGARQEEGGDEKPAQKPAAKPGERPAPAQPGTAPAPKPVRRPVPTPGEVFPRRKPQQRLAVV